MDIDRSQPFITLADGTEVQVLDERGSFDEAATAVAQFETVLEQALTPDAVQWAEEQLAALPEVES